MRFDIVRGRFPLKVFFVLFACAVFGYVQQASAVLVSYEPFEYTAGSEILGLNGGGGFGAAWTGRANNAANVPAGTSAVQAASMAHPTQPGDLPTIGGSMLLDATQPAGTTATTQPARDLSAQAKSILDAAPTTWFSFLGQRQGVATDPMISNLPNNPYPRGVNLSLFGQDVATDDELVGFGNSSNATDNTYSIVPDGGGSNREGAYDPAGSASPGVPDNVGAATFPYQNLEWVVVRIDHQVGVDNIYMWLSPDPLSEPSTASADATILSTDTNAFEYGSIGAIRAFVGNQGGTPNAENWRPAGAIQLDEIRLGTTYADMRSTTVVPEPAAFLLMLLGGLGALAIRRRG
jgi:hypothetical protein